MTILAGLLLFAATCAPRTFPTPLELADGDVLTSHDDMMSFLAQLQSGTQAFTMETIGSSLEGRSLVALRFADPAGSGSGSAEKLRVLVYAQQHGNEPSGKEAAIALARDIATGGFTGFLSSVDFFLVPQMNPDGSEIRQRGNASGMDLNRDHITLSTPEVAALHALFNDVLPEATLDVHEYGFAGSSWVEAGLHKNFGQQIGALSNPNMSLALREYAWNRVIPGMTAQLAPRQVLLQRYLVTDGPAERYRYSTTALNDGRNSMGIYNSLSFLTEGRNGLTVESDIRERARQQLETIKAFLTFLGDNASEVKGLVEAERGNLTLSTLPPEVALVMDYVPDPERPDLTVGVIDVETGEARTMAVGSFHPLVEATLWVNRPMGYTIPAGLTDVLAVLHRHGMETIPVETSTTATLETYRIAEVLPGTLEDKDFLDVKVEVTEAEAEVPAGDVIVWCDQMASNLIVTLLEPQSQWGLAALPEFASLLTVGSTYPIRRIIAVPD